MAELLGTLTDHRCASFTLRIVYAAGRRTLWILPGAARLASVGPTPVNPQILTTATPSDTSLPLPC